MEPLPNERKDSLAKTESHVVDLKRKCLFSCYKVITNSSKKKKAKMDLKYRYTYVSRKQKRKREHPAKYRDFIS